MNKGTKHTDVSLQKMSKAHQNQVAWNKGLKGIQTKNSGSFKKGEHRGLATEFKKGYDVKNHWNWRGGITSENQTVRVSVEYKKWRIAVFERDSYTCIWCGAKSGNGKKVILHADHIKPFAFFPELRFEISNGRTLCNECHRYTTTYMGRAARYNRKPKIFTPIVDRVEYGGGIVGAEEHDAIFQVILSQGSRRWTIGSESLAFEAELAATTGVQHAVVANSGSSALLLTIAALKLPKGSPIMIPACNFPTAFNAIIQNGHVPVVVDVELDTFNLDLEEAERIINLYPDIQAVIAVNIAGNPVDLVKLRSIVGERKILLDNCDGYGTTVNGRFVETYADVACVSFHAAHIITTGEGGAILTNDKELAATAVKLREWGRASGTDKVYQYPGFPDDYKERYVYEEIGYNLKPLELQCAMGRVQLKKLQQFKDARRKNYNALVKAFSGNESFTVIQATTLGADTCWFSFPLLVKENRGKIMQAFEDNNIETRTVFSGNILLHPAYKDVEYIKTSILKRANAIMARGMFLSCHPSLTQEMIDFIGEVARKI